MNILFSVCVGGAIYVPIYIHVILKGNIDVQLIEDIHCFLFLLLNFCRTLKYRSAGLPYSRT